MILRQHRHVGDRSRELVDGHGKVESVDVYHVRLERPHAREQPTRATRQADAASQSSGHASRIVDEMEGDAIMLERLALACRLNDGNIHAGTSGR
jgi:hypothetical protein